MPHRASRFAIALAAASFIAPVPAQDEIRLETERSSADAYVRSDSDTVAVREGSAMSGTDGPRRDSPGIATDGEALAVLTAINAHQVAIAELAQRKGVGPAAEAFAREVARDQRGFQHRTRRVGDQAGINPFDSDDVKIVRQRGSSERAALDALGAGAFEAEFIASMVQINGDAIIAVDEVLLPAAKDPGVQAHLRDARSRFAGHLERARTLSLPSQAAR